MNPSEPMQLDEETVRKKNLKTIDLFTGPRTKVNFTKPSQGPEFNFYVYQARATLLPNCLRQNQTAQIFSTNQNRRGQGPKFNF